MTLTVRLDPTLSWALELHCAERGVTKSLVVQESLARYLVSEAPARRGPRSTATTGKPGPEPSANYKAFEAAGFIGAGVGGGRSADKAAVRERIRRRASRNWD